MKCDFCSSAIPSWDYPAKDFKAVVIAITSGGDTQSFDWNSEGGWLACSECAHFIERVDQPGLTAHVVNHFMEMQKHPPDYRRPLSESLTGLHKQFFDSRTGPRKPWS